MSSPAVVHKSKFVFSNSKVFSSYIDYIDRDEATRTYKYNEFSLYNDYMGNPNKSGSLFTSTKDFLNEKDKETLKDQFKLAQENKSIMWQDVFSFNNDWLEEHGYYDSETHILDEEKLRGAIRRCMNNNIEKSNMGSAIWSASFHYNTDNIHVHIATVELTNNPKQRGKRVKSELDRMKSDFINELLNRESEHKKINELIRENIVDKREKFLSSDDKFLKNKTMEVLKKLPSNKKYWYYGYNKINSVKPLLNEISKYYIEKYHKEDYKELMKKLTLEELELRKIYGEGKEGKEKGRYKDYKKNKEDELYKRMGNSILKELREYAINEEQKFLKNRSYYDKQKEKNFNEDKITSLTLFTEDIKDKFNSNFSKEYNKENFFNDYFNKGFYSSSKVDKNFDKVSIKHNNKFHYEHGNKVNISINKSVMSKLKKAMKNDLENYINQREYERNERDREREQERYREELEL